MRDGFETELGPKAQPLPRMIRSLIRLLLLLRQLVLPIPFPSVLIQVRFLQVKRLLEGRQIQELGR